MTRQEIELTARSDGSRYRRVVLLVEEDGALTLRSHDMGAGALAAWNDDQEITLRIPAREVALLAAGLVQEKLAGGTDAVARLEHLCDDHGVSFRTACWS